MTRRINTCDFEDRESLQQEQPEVDLEKEIKDWCDENITGVRPIYTADSLIYGLLPKCAHHFYGLRNRALEKAVLRVYESWMGGTMDDIRRDMAELGTLIKARKEDSK